ncbi:type II toxin-antitoxin system VapC family toxin [Gemmata sp.]|uniref:type II toxin-antitoxin system VapC family toxin n=1 Tax=Gemmata sp. TaxID=1914242 RepID=UPI003F70E7B8
MSVFILDTDILTLYQHGDETVVSAVLAARERRVVVALTAVTVEEQAKGWFASFSKARTPAQVAQASRLFSGAVELWGTFRIFPQTEASLARFDLLVAAKLNVGKMDLRIASIALELGATVVTHNLRDFGRVPGLLLADWTAPQTPQSPAPPAP